MLELLANELNNFGGKFTKESFFHLVSKILEFSVTYPVAFLFIERQNHSEYLLPYSLEIEKRINELVIAYIEEGQQDGIVRPGNPLVYSAVVYGALVELFKQHYERKNIDAKPANFETACAALWGAIARQ